MRAKREEEERKRLEEALRARQEEERKRLEEEELARQKQVEHLDNVNLKHLNNASHFSLIASRLTQCCKSLGGGIKTTARARGGTAQTKRGRGETGTRGSSAQIRGEAEGRGGEKETGRVPSQTGNQMKTCHIFLPSMICEMSP